MMGKYSFTMTELRTGVRSKESFLTFIKDCAKALHGISGTTVQEIREDCVKLYPHMYSWGGNFAPAPVPALSVVPLESLPQRLE